ncbi:MAG: Dolichyl-phosphate mannose synthase related protein [Candidatus Nomurabacteria bacterium GW2011_GWA1_40_8]|nr:MAG: Dolichyl-phosphate mannose synthase related protein [Candidatus Nomurabacteria bacterium GW2011_GWA1_40_8]
MNIWVVIPAFNEGKRIKGVLKNVKKFTPHIIVVDDGSKDETSAVAKGEEVILLPHITNLGKGAALKTGSQHVKTTYFGYIDADRTYHPKEFLPHA